MAEKIRRYAQDTKVQVGASQDELRTLLRKAGAGGISLTDDPETKRIVVVFKIEGRFIKLRASTERPSRRCAPEQLEREAWRSLVLRVKAKLDVIAAGDSTFEEEFLANIMLPSGDTVGDDVLPKIAHAYQSGTMPPLLGA